MYRHIDVYLQQIHMCRYKVHRYAQSEVVSLYFVNYPLYRKCLNKSCVFQSDLYFVR
jgi:hypothetical protein